MYRRYNDTFKQYISMNLSKGNISMRVLPSTYKMLLNKFIYKKKRGAITLRQDELLFVIKKTAVDK